MADADNSGAHRRLGRAELPEHLLSPPKASDRDAATGEASEKRAKPASADDFLEIDLKAFFTGSDDATDDKEAEGDARGGHDTIGEMLAPLISQNPLVTFAGYDRVTGKLRVSAASQKDALKLVGACVERLELRLSAIRAGFAAGLPKDSLDRIVQAVEQSLKRTCAKEGVAPNPHFAVYQEIRESLVPIK